MGKTKRTVLTKLGVHPYPSASGDARTAPAVAGKCVGCHTPIVWALDDRYTAKEEIGSLFNCDPDPEGFAMLWYAVDRHGIPSDTRQWFRVTDPDGGYTGPLWSRHLCPTVQS